MYKWIFQVQPMIKSLIYFCPVIAARAGQGLFLLKEELENVVTAKDCSLAAARRRVETMLERRLVSKIEVKFRSFWLPHVEFSSEKCLSEFYQFGLRSNLWCTSVGRLGD